MGGSDSSAVHSVDGHPHIDPPHDVANAHTEQDADPQRRNGGANACAQRCTFQGADQRCSHETGSPDRSTCNGGPVRSADDRRSRVAHADAVSPPRTDGPSAAGAH
eukprot:gene46295-21134_t